MDKETILLTVAGMALVTYIPRMVPALFLSSRTLNPYVERWLGFIPAAVLSAMLFPSLLVKQGAIDISPGNIFLLAAVPTFVVAYKGQSFFGAVAMGMALVALARLFGLGA